MYVVVCKEAYEIALGKKKKKKKQFHSCFLEPKGQSSLLCSYCKLLKRPSVSMRSIEEQFSKHH